jgi:hypothetical protein
MEISSVGSAFSDGRQALPASPAPEGWVRADLQPELARPRRHRQRRKTITTIKDDRERTDPSPRRPPTTADRSYPHQQLSLGWYPPPQGGSAHVNDDINVLALVKGRERYIFLYEDSQRAEALRTLGRFASNPELSFTWYDAAVLSQKVRHNTPSGEIPTLAEKLPRRINTPQASDVEWDD